jgi:hypothetical protein
MAAKATTTATATYPDKRKRNPRLKQTSLFALAGVVVVEELYRNKKALEDDSVDDGEKEKILEKLKAKRPATKLIIETGIGKTVKRLAKKSSAANDVYKLWRSEVEKRESLKERGPLEVECDADTTSFRLKARRMLGEAGIHNERIAGAIEKQLFDRTGHLVNVAYRRTVRRIVFNCKHRPEVRKRLLTASSSTRARLVGESLDESIATVGKGGRRSDTYVERR